VDGVGPAARRGGHDGVRIEEVERAGTVRGREDRADAEALARGGDATGDLAPVGDEDARRQSGRPGRTAARSPRLDVRRPIAGDKRVDRVARDAPAARTRATTSSRASTARKKCRRIRVRVSAGRA
jgi:hypothetical protein